MARQYLVLTLSGVVLAALQAGSVFAKDIGPANPACDAHAKASQEWRACAARVAETDGELFYAGYWLARNGQYDQALTYLKQAEPKTTRVLTYIGFATRKLGRVDEAMGLYAEALAKNPDNTVARAYLGEAHLQLGNLRSAESELGEIAQRCGTSCVEYGELAGHIADYKQGAQLPG
jgi:tetratricopeptide (TPR) repeat protein